MSLNITLDGYTYDKDETISNSDVKYQGFFYNNGTASSSPTWNNVRIVESTGYYNINLGDADWLGQNGVALSNAKVIIVFWKGSPLGDDRNALCDILEEWGTFEVTLDGSSVYSQDSQIKNNIYPVLQWSHNVPSHGYVDTLYSTTNTSYDVHGWSFDGIATSGTVTMNHWRTRYGENIQLINTVSGTDYYWGDTTPPDLNLPGAANASHQWSVAGTYDINIVIEDECSVTVTGTDQIDIYWHAPTADIIMISAAPDPNDLVSFQWGGTDVDSRITSIDWIIYDSGIYGNTDTTINGQLKGATVSHSAGTGTDWCGEAAAVGAFTNPGTHNVAIVIKWNDGFTDRTLPYDENFTQNRFTGPAMDFEQAPAQATVGSGIEFTNISTNVNRVGLGLPDCTKYDWEWNDNGLIETELDKLYSYKLVKTSATSICLVELCADWSDGWDTQQACEQKNIVFATVVTISEEDCYYNLNAVGTSGDGTISGYNWTVSSGISETGPWTETWASPVGLDQNDKKVCFTKVGWYKIIGYIYGTGATTNDDAIIYIATICPPGSVTPVPILESELVLQEYGKRYMRAKELKPIMVAKTP